MINQPIDDKKTVKMTEPALNKDEEDDTKTTFQKPSSSKHDHKANDESTYKRGKITLSQGYDYKGEKAEIGIILALKNERFTNKVVFTAFIDKMIFWIFVKVYKKFILYKEAIWNK